METLRNILHRLEFLSGDVGRIRDGITRAEDKLGIFRNKLLATESMLNDELSELREFLRKQEEAGE